MFALQAVDDDRLLELLRDPRSDVRSLAEKELLERLPPSSSLRHTLVSAILNRTVPVAFAARALSSGFELNAGQVSELTTLFDHADGKWRLAAMGLLCSLYLNAERIKAHATRLSSDPEAEIRERAKRILRAQ